MPLHLSQIKSAKLHMVTAMSKTPYEIRLDVLAMAQKLLQDEYHSQASVLTDYSRIMPPRNKKEYDEMIEKHSPKVITTGDIVSKANELYAFVDDNTSSSTRSYNATTTGGTLQRSLLTEEKPNRK